MLPAHAHARGASAGAGADISAALRAERAYGCVSGDGAGEKKECQHWAATGECVTNAAFMCGTCASACAEVGEGECCVPPGRRMASVRCLGGGVGNAESACRYAFMEFSVGGSPVGRVTFALFSDVVPLTVDNFAALLPRYESSSLHRVIPGFMSQGGASAGPSIYGAHFDDENFVVSYDEPFLLGMANSGKNTNGAQWFLTVTPTHHLDGKHVVFGGVLAGFGTAMSINEAGSPSGKPQKEIIVTAAKEITLEQAQAAVEAEMRRAQDATMASEL